MSEMIERVARALCASDAIWNAFRPDYLEKARAAIKAMREPTEAMLENDAIDRITIDKARAIHSSSLPCDEIWRAMIDAAIKP